MTQKALEGIKVLEMCRMVCGPYAAKLMADLGAEVIKVEEPGKGDPARSRGPFQRDIPHPERSGLFLYLNTNKLSITLNLRKPAGKKAFKQLIKETDILIEDNPPGFMKKLGLDFDSLQAVNPMLVMTSVTPFGQTGPYKSFKAFHMNVYHAGGDGYLLSSGPEFWHREPTRGGRYLGDYEAGATAAGATMAALYARDVIGGGQHVDVSMQEALISLNRGVLARYPNEGVVESRATRQYEWGGIMRCKDGYVLLQAFNEPHHWTGLVDLMGSPEWAKDEKYRTKPARAANRDELNAHILDWMKDRTMDEIYHGGQARSVPVGPFYSPKDVVNNVHLNARGFFAEIDHPETGRLKYPSMPFKLSATPVGAGVGAPLLGQHNDDILGHRLGYSHEDLIRLRGDGVI
ncbi:MAG: CoA transferase [Chloroflexi bacterium]|nr:CoA transferase [Chloroflexota bacterium]